MTTTNTNNHPLTTIITNPTSHHLTLGSSHSTTIPQHLTHSFPTSSIAIPLLDCNNKRQLQDSNLRGQNPVDFESTSLTTRTNCLVLPHHPRHPNYTSQSSLHLDPTPHPPPHNPIHHSVTSLSLHTHSTVTHSARISRLPHHHNSPHIPYAPHPHHDSPPAHTSLGRIPQPPPSKSIPSTHSTQSAHTATNHSCLHCIHTTHQSSDLRYSTADSVSSPRTTAHALYASSTSHNRIPIALITPTTQHACMHSLTSHPRSLFPLVVEDSPCLVPVNMCLDMLCRMSPIASDIPTTQPQRHQTPTSIPNTHNNTKH